MIGAVLGGVIGHQFGGSNRAQAGATAAGALIGGVVGNSVDRSNGVGYVAQPTYYTQPVAVTRDVQRCTTVNQVNQRIVGYDVRYVYNGREFATRMPHAPGRTLRVNVDVHPYGQRRVSDVTVRRRRSTRAVSESARLAGEIGSPWTYASRVRELCGLLGIPDHEVRALAGFERARFRLESQRARGMQRRAGERFLGREAEERAGDVHHQR